MRHCQRLYRDVYLPCDAELTAACKAHAIWLATGPDVVVAGLSAAALWRTKWLSVNAPAEIVRTSRRRIPGVVVRSDGLADNEITRQRGIRLTTPARTAFDIRRTQSRDKVVPILDALVRATGVQIAEITRIAEAHPGARGIRQCREVLSLVDGGAESPPESRLRLIVIAAGLPAPETQISFPALRIRVDMGWREWKIAVEYDGLQHWSNAAQRAWDIDRIALLEAEGWIVIRVSAAMMAQPWRIVERISSALRSRGCPVL